MHIYTYIAPFICKGARATFHLRNVYIFAQRCGDRRNLYAGEYISESPFVLNKIFFSEFFLYAKDFFCFKVHFLNYFL